MSSTALLWLAIFVALTLASLRRPVYAALGYQMIFYVSPVFWWFGSGLLTSLTMRWSLVAAIILAIANFATWKDLPKLSSLDRKFLWLLLLIGVNGFAVNAMLANYPPASDRAFDILWKSCLTSGLIYVAIRCREDLDLFLFGIVICCGFVGYQIVLSGAGSIEGGRLEGIRFAGAQGSNATAAVLSVGLVLAGYFVISMHDRIRAVASLVIAPLLLESILRCNSRGSYLGLIAAAFTIVVLAKGAARKRAILLCTVGMVAVLTMAGNEAIWRRFDSIFAKAEERDGSAAERLEYWEAAINMISDYPLGSGGGAAFTSPRGVGYIAQFRPEFRSVHNGPLDIAAGWGIQGLLLLAIILVASGISAWRTTYVYLAEGDVSGGFLGSVLLAAMIGQLVCCMFTSVLDGEWFLWIAGSCFAYTRTCPSSQADEVVSEVEDVSVELVVS